jgi:twitching motility protein PilT
LIALTAARALVFSTSIRSTRRRVEHHRHLRGSDQQAVRTPWFSFRYFVSQRLIPKIGGGRVAVLEVLKSTLRTRDYMERGEAEGKTLLDAMRDGELDGMQHFDGEIEKLVRQKVISRATALLYSTNAGNLQVQLADVPDDEAAVVVG